MNVCAIVRIKIQGPLFYKKVQLRIQAEIILYKFKLYAGWNLDIVQIKVIQDRIGDVDFIDGSMRNPEIGKDNQKPEKELEDVDLSDLM
jgi:hypothetical protein